VYRVLEAFLLNATLIFTLIIIIIIIIIILINTNFLCQSSIELTLLQTATALVDTKVMRITDLEWRLLLSDVW